MRAPRATPAAAAVLSALVLVLASACSSASTAAPNTSNLEKTSLVVGATPAEAVTPLYIAAQRGIFARYGLNVKIQPIQSTGASKTVPNLLNGTFDVAAGQVTTFIAAQASGQGTFRVLASGLEIGPHVNELLTMPGFGISSPADLKGKTIAVNAPTGNGVLLTDALLATYNIQPSQVHFTSMQFSDMAQELDNHAVDAIYVTEPYVAQAEQQFGATVVADLDQGAAQSMMVGGFTVTTAWAAKYPHTAAAFAAAIDQAAEVADTNIAAAQRAFQVYLPNTSPAVADVMATGTFPSSVSVAKLRQLVDLMSEFGELNGTFNAQVMVGQ